MSERKELYAGDITQPYAKGQGLGNQDAEIFFLAPIDLLEGDKVIVDPGSGQPLAVYREGRKMWQYEGDCVSGSMTAKLNVNPEALEALYKAMGRG